MTCSILLMHRVDVTAVQAASEVFEANAAQVRKDQEKKVVILAFLIRAAAPVSLKQQNQQQQIVEKVYTFSQQHILGVP